MCVFVYICIHCLSKKDLVNYVDLGFNVTGETIAFQFIMAAKGS